MEAYAKAKYIRVSPRKVSRYGKAIVRKPFREATTALMVSPSRGARILNKVLNSAVANLMEKSKNIDEGTIIVDNVIVNQGPTLKRWLPRARGRADRIRKRTCHIFIEVSGSEIEK